MGSMISSVSSDKDTIVCLNFKTVGTEPLLSQFCGMWTEATK